jgi:hypothetical protein
MLFDITSGYNKTDDSQVDEEFFGNFVDNDDIRTLCGAR